MNEKINLDYCIMKNPFGFDCEDDYSIFFTKKGLVDIDDSLKQEDQYSKLVDFLKSKGYLETDDFKFEYIDNKLKLKRLNIDQIKNMLEKAGARYNPKFEQTIQESYDQIMGDLDPELLRGAFEIMQNDTDLVEILQSPEEYIEEAKMEENKENKKKKITDKIKRKINVPKVGDKIMLSLYLFLQCTYLEDESDFDIDLHTSLTLKNKKSQAYRSYIKVINTEFERTEDLDGVMVLKSVRDKGDFLKEISFLYDGFFDIVKLKDYTNEQLFFEKNRFFFCMMDVKDRIREEERLVLEIEDNDEYFGMIDISDEILEELEEQKDHMLKIEDIEDMTEDVLDILESKMFDFSEDEEFLEAARVKKEIGYIKNVVDKLVEDKGEDGEINFHEFHALLPVKPS